MKSIGVFPGAFRSGQLFFEVKHVREENAVFIEWFGVVVGKESGDGVRVRETEPGVKSHAGACGSHIHRPETCRVEFEQGFHQAGGIPLLLELGVGGEVIEFAGSVGIGDDHSHADGRVADGEDMHIPGFQIAIDHGFAGVREQKERKVLFFVGRDGLEGGHCRSPKKG